MVMGDETMKGEQMTREDAAKKLARISDRMKKEGVPPVTEEKVKLVTDALDIAIDALLRLDYIEETVNFPELMGYLMGGTE